MLNDQTKLRSTNEANPKMNNNFKSLVYNSAIKRNPILVSGMAVAPVVVLADTFMKSVSLVITFSFLTVFTLLVSSFVSQKIVYTVRIILYALIGALVYVPAAIFLNAVMPNEIAEMGVYFPLLIVNSFIISYSETAFFIENKGNMILDILFSVLGYDIVVLIFGFVREIISTGEFNGKIIAMPMIFSGFSETYGGFLLLGIFAALFRGIILLVQKIKP